MIYSIENLTQIAIKTQYTFLDYERFLNFVVLFNHYRQKDSSIRVFVNTRTQIAYLNRLTQHLRPACFLETQFPLPLTYQNSGQERFVHYSSLDLDNYYLSHGHVLRHLPFNTAPLTPAFLTSDVGFKLNSHAN